MKRGLLSFLLLAYFCSISAQQNSKKINIGFEADFLPYATGGYFGAAWAGKNKWRVRLLTAKVNKPDWFTASGFTNHRINAYACVADYFLKTGWKGAWLGGGVVYWKSSIQTDAKIETARFSNFLLNGSAGFAISLYKNLYISPWAGISIRTAGDKNVPVDDRRFTLPLINPEASLKLGYFF